MDHMKNITLKTNDVTNIVRRYYFNTYNTFTAKKKKSQKSVTSNPGLPYIRFKRVISLHLWLLCSVGMRPQTQQ
jgi:hypothetical protein